MGGGGANLLDSLETGDNSDFEGDDKDPKNDEKNEEEYIVTYKTYEDYFTDLNITAETITENDLVGVGSESNPYIVHSTRGFLWLTNYSLSKIYLNNKFIELACDIILNDETFDENGTPTGGDGVVYSWEPNETIADVASGGLYGNGHYISGLFFSDNQRDYVSIFGKRIREAKHISFQNAYIYARNYVSLIATDIPYLDDCHALSGNIKANYFIGVFANTNTMASNSTNRINLVGNSAAGIITRTNRAINLTNYGNVIGHNNSSGNAGICNSLSGENVLFSNCINYGKVTGSHNHIGGILGAAYGSRRKVEFSNCVNYGNISVSGSYVGGLAGTISGNVFVKNCENYGRIGGYAAGEFVGYLYSYDDNITSNMFITNSLSSSPNTRGLVGFGTLIENLIIKNCKIDYSGTRSRLFGDLWIRVNKMLVQNIDIELKTEPNTLYCFSKLLARSLYQIENINIYGKGAKTTKILPFSEYGETNEILTKNVIIQQNGNNSYYGTDFSGFYVDWKSGKIGLKALSGKGFYQGKVSEEYLKNNGFVLMTI